jgi:hypothetical protein
MGKTRPKTKFTLPPRVEEGDTMTRGIWVPILERFIPQHVLDGLEPGTRAFTWGRMTIFVSRDPRDNHWHISIDGKERYPTWDEMVGLRYALIPNGVSMAMYLPPLEVYVNHGEFVFQIHEVPLREEDEHPLPPHLVRIPTALRNGVPQVQWLPAKE